MKVGLHLGLGQHLTMTPQLQQAIKLLQLSTLELQQEVQSALDSNPLLELDDGSEPAGMSSEPHDSTPEAPDKAGETLDLDQRSDMPDQLPVDTAWDDIYVGSGSGTGGEPVDEDGDPIETRNAQAESLQDHLRWQLNLTPFNDTDRLVAEAVIDGLDSRGYLTVSLQELADTVQHWIDEVPEEDEILAVLHRVQQFDPPGVAARDLCECLLIQLGQRPAGTEGLAGAQCLLRDHADKLAAGDLPGLMRATRLSEAEIQQVMALIRQLKPHPGEGWAGPDDEKTLIPDVVVRKHNGRWRVELNPEAAPRLRVNSGYAAMLRRADSSRDNQFIRDHLQEARWLIKSLQSRHETLLKVATCIVEHQRGFLEEGPEAMKPLILRDVADEVGLHESTISRVTTQKYLHTPRGLFELKYFFSSHVGTSSGGEASSTAIRAMIKKLVAQENPRKPLSDNKIADLLQEQGIEVARRTIAKYRESLNIPSSSDRKRLL
ncbi:RNA polymerase factor sigma-54 [Amnimonas aquatica]|uniref:RNA polymerase sigma-54 factor n=1 Tax=Amnimonas aquatica TaxID=2094561 RepID=A0A2P6AVC7_9GAMM|nr:RNA polymerase factor sigma-54 [Amnimonas aquatica]PQA52118.1 RNA polymerase factor sigma-54 [Amnimonas aquatica]